MLSLALSPEATIHDEPEILDFGELKPRFFLSEDDTDALFDHLELTNHGAVVTRKLRRKAWTPNVNT